jgi:hypothetical protein
MRASLPLVTALAMIAGLLPMRNVRAQAPGPASAVVGAWTLNKDLSDAPAEKPSDDGDTPDRGQRRRGGGGGGGGGGFGRGGFGGGGRGGQRGGQRGGGAAAIDPETAARLRDAIRELRTPPEHLIIVQTDTMVIITGPDGRTIRLSPDGRKIKDEATRMERKTKWDAGKLVSEVSGPAGIKVTETYSADAERHQLHVTVHSDDDRRPFTLNRVYDADSASR